METRLNVCVFMMCEFSLNVNMVSNLGALEQWNNQVVVCVHYTANCGSGLRAAAITTKQAIFPWELKMR